MISRQRFEHLFCDYEHTPVQNYFELFELFTWFDGRVTGNAIIEIGTFHGGTLRFWHEILQGDGVLISIDNNARGSIPHVQKAFSHDSRVHFIIDDSRSKSAFDAVQSILGERQADILFIDGDHAYQNVCFDVDTYGQLVRPGGYIVMHDISAGGPKCKWDLELATTPHGYRGFISFMGGTKPVGIGLMLK
jgi:cephalosporin hydroxylase|tara:strand:+ start:470 stop:1042 length:573 start_codon:yes stop_codon:yes gene_type:complete